MLSGVTSSRYRVTCSWSVAGAGPDGEWIASRLARDDLGFGALQNDLCCGVHVASLLNWKRGAPFRYTPARSGLERLLVKTCGNAHFAHTRR
jgi:hypothetical protein